VHNNQLVFSKHNDLSPKCHNSTKPSSSSHDVGKDEDDKDAFQDAIQLCVDKVEAITDAKGDSMTPRSLLGEKGVSPRDKGHPINDNTKGDLHVCVQIIGSFRAVQGLHSACLLY